MTRDLLRAKGILVNGSVIHRSREGEKPVRPFSNDEIGAVIGGVYGIEGRVPIRVDTVPVGNELIAGDREAGPKYSVA
jgi:hypothetical protein